MSTRRHWLLKNTGVRARVTGVVIEDGRVPLLNQGTDTWVEADDPASAFQGHSLAVYGSGAEPIRRSPSDFGERRIVRRDGLKSRLQTLLQWWE